MCSRFLNWCHRTKCAHDSWLGITELAVHVLKPVLYQACIVAIKLQMMSTHDSKKHAPKLAQVLNSATPHLTFNNKPT